MDTNQPLTYQQILDRISSDKALHAVLMPLLEEVRQLREELAQTREVLGDISRTKHLTVPEVAEMFGVGEQTVRNRVNSGKWPAWRDGRQVRFGPEDIEAIRAWGRPKTPAPRRTALETRQRNKALLASMPNW